ncbi:hypothetical protein J6590_057439 [Homalodisca vitripennis]|nr:hypothetical protein J6590_057439 [Homalodisca vitripennis]
MSKNTKSENIIDNTHESDINDAFDCIAFSEEHFTTSGFNDGFERGKQIGNFEGYHLGYHRGAELGAEIGFYKGFIEALLKTAGNEVLSHHCTVIEKLASLIGTFPSCNDEKTDIITLRNQIRSTYKRLCSLLKISSDLPGNSHLEF